MASGYSKRRLFDALYGGGLRGDMIYGFRIQCERLRKRLKKWLNGMRGNDWDDIGMLILLFVVLASIILFMAGLWFISQIGYFGGRL